MIRTCCNAPIHVAQSNCLTLWGKTTVLQTGYVVVTGKAVTQAWSPQSPAEQLLAQANGLAMLSGF